MVFSDAEKLGLLMLCDMYKNTPGVTEFDADLISEAVRRGYNWALRWEYGGIGWSDVNTPNEVSEVSDILEMWTHMEQSYERFDEAELADLALLVPHFQLPVKFPGFDGNNDEQYGIATFLIERLRRWSNFHDRDLNSHSEVMPGYRQMLPIYRDLRSKGFFQYDVQTVASFLNAEMRR